MTKPIICRIEDLEAAVANQTDLDEQQLNIDCDEGELQISKGNSVPLDQLGTRVIYRYAPPAEPGLRARWWLDTAGPHLDPLEWTGPADPGVGFPLPTAAAPDFDVINNSNNVNDSNSGAGAARYGVIDGWVYLPAGTTHWREDNQNTGEFGMVLSGDCCSDLVEQPGGNHDTNTSASDRSLMDPTPIGEGWVYVYNPQSDSGAFQGLELEHSTDGGATWAPIAQRQPEQPIIEVQEVAACDEIPEGWQIEPLATCCAPTYTAPAEPGGLDEAAVQALIDAQDIPQAATALPVADNEVDTAIRTGIIGTSADFARADHNHPIRRQANPGDPDLVVGGAAVITQATVILDRWSTEEEYTFNTRTRVSIEAGTGWGWITVPTIAGFQQPQIIGLGSYRSDSLRPQTDDGVQGAAPRGPLMAREVHHWSSTNRLYIAYFRRDEAITSMFIEAVIRYIRN